MITPTVLKELLFFMVLVLNQYLVLNTKQVWVSESVLDRKYGLGTSLVDAHKQASVQIIHETHETRSISGPVMTNSWESWNSDLISHRDRESLQQGNIDGTCPWSQTLRVVSSGSLYPSWYSVTVIILVCLTDAPFLQQRHWQTL